MADLCEEKNLEEFGVEAIVENEDDKLTWFMHRSIIVRRRTLINLATVSLVVSLFMERYCFIVTVYKTRYYGYVLILTVFALNMLFSFVVLKCRSKTKKVKESYQVFEIERQSNLGCCIYSFLGLLDMFYAFFFFWPSNVIPMWLLVTLLQVFIPLNMGLRMCALKLSFHPLQKVSGVIILLAIGVNYFNLLSKEYRAQNYLAYSLLFIVASIIDTISHSLKESIVRSQPIMYDEFTYVVCIS